MAGFIQANTNGMLHDAREASVSPLDRGFLYGDAVYEVWRTYGHTLFAAEEHWRRLEGSAEGIGMKLPVSFGEILAEIRRTAVAWRLQTGSQSELYVRLQVSRGAGEVGLHPRLAGAPSWVILVKELNNLDEPSLDRGYRVGIARRVRRNPCWALSPELKTGNYLNNIMGLNETRESCWDDVLMLNDQGHLTEGTTRNLWLVFEDRIATPPMDSGILAGVTRGIILKRGKDWTDRPIVEEVLSPDELSEAGECFLSSSTQDIQPVGRIEDHLFPTGPETVTRKMKDGFLRWVAEYVKANSRYQIG